MTADIIIYGGFLITMEGKGTGIIPNGALAIKGNQIADVGTTDDILHRYQAHRYINAENKAVLPGLIDTHIHTSNAIVRGCSQDIEKWMYSGILPLLSLAKTEDLVAGSMLNIVEAVKKGTTTFCDYDFPMLELIKNHIRVGTRVVAAEMINELPTVTYGVQDTQLRDFDPAKGNRQLMDAIQLVEQYHQSNGGRITCMMGPQATEMCSIPLLREIKNYADQNQLDIHMHVAQGERETRQVLERYGKRPVELLDELGYLTPKLHAAHITETNDAERKLLAERGVSMALCSCSIGIINGELPPAQEYMQCGGKVGLGSDQAPGNNCNNLFNEMKFTAIMHKYKNHNATVFPAWKVLRMATIEAAQAMGIADQVGSLRSGKKADVILVDLLNPALSPILPGPVRNIVPNLVYAANGSEVETVIIDGQVVVDQHEILTVSEKDVVSAANRSAMEICKRLKQTGWEKNLPLAKWGEVGYY